MKYIRLFRESSENKDDYYVQISPGEYNTEVHCISMNRFNYDYIKDLFNNKSGTWRHIPSVEFSDFCGNIKFRIYHNDRPINYVIEIYEYDDEYFTVWINEKVYGLNSKNTFYRCDQIGGVEELLRDKGFISGNII